MKLKAILLAALVVATLSGLYAYTMVQSAPPVTRYHYIVTCPVLSVGQSTTADYQADLFMKTFATNFHDLEPLGSVGRDANHFYYLTPQQPWLEGRVGSKLKVRFPDQLANPAHSTVIETAVDKTLIDLGWVPPLTPTGYCVFVKYVDQQEFEVYP